MTVDCAIKRAWRRWSVLAVLLVGLLVVAGGTPAGAVDIERVKTPGGLEAWLVQDHTNPIITFRFSFRGGSSGDPVGKEGLTEMTASLLDEGAGDLDAETFHARLEDGSFSISFDAGRDTIGGSLRTLRRNHVEAFDLLRLALTQPRFDAEPIERVRNQTLVGLLRAEEDPGSIAYKLMASTFYPNHPYGRPSNGTRETIQGLTRDDFVGVVKRLMARDNLILGVVGDTTPDEIAKLIDQTFGGLPAKATIPEVSVVPPQAGGDTLVVRKTVPQSTILFAQNGLMRDDPDFYTAYVLNHILGGGSFSSRLYAEVREKRGLAYSIYTGLYPSRHSAMLMGSAGTANARVGETVRLVREEWQRMAAGAVTADELRNAKDYLTGSYPLQFTSSGRIAAALVSLQLDDLGIDYIDKRNGLMEAVGLDDIRRVATRLLQPDRLTFFVVGEPQGLVDPKEVTP